MQRLLVMALLLSVGGAGCGGCVDEDTKTRGNQVQPASSTDKIRRQRAVATFLGDAGLAAPEGDR